MGLQFLVNELVRYKGTLTMTNKIKAKGLLEKDREERRFALEALQKTRKK